MAKAKHKQRRRRNIPISLSSTDTYTTAEYLTSVLGSRTLAYIVAQPPSFLFIVCLLILSVLLPFLGLYVGRADRLPDLDTMMSWKTFTGKLRKESLCLNDTKSTVKKLPQFPELCENKQFITISAGIKIEISDTGLLSDDEVWYANFPGSSLGVSVSNKNGSSLQDCITVRLLVPFSSKTCHHKVCDACLLIRVPKEANNLDDVQNGNQPYYSCPALNATKSYRELYIKERTSCVVVHVKEEYRQHGIVLVYLNKEEQSTSEHRLYLCAGLALLVAVIFGILSSLTDKPRSGRLGNE